MITTDDIKSALAGLNISVAWHSFLTMPSDHAFATWNISKAQFDGGDEYAMIKYLTAEVFIFFKDIKIDSDFELEERFEESIRAAGSFTRISDYDSDNKLFYSKYTFEYGEEF